MFAADPAPRDIDWKAEFRTDGKAKPSLSVRGVSIPLDAKAGTWHKLRLVLVGSRATLWVDGKVVKQHVKLGELKGDEVKAVGAELRSITTRKMSAGEANAVLRNNGGAGYKSIFNGKDFTGWTGPVDNYEVKDEAIVCKPKKGGNIYTRAEYSDFSARVEYRLPPGGNNGLAIRYPGKGQPSQVAMCEVQVLDDTAKMYAKLDPRQYNGSVYGIIAAKRGHLRPVGEWNFMEVTVRGHHIEVELNGTVIVSGDVSKVTKFKDGTHPGRLRLKGHFGFAGHNDPVAFRNIEVRELTGK
jgi:hypothetical protein